MVNVSRLEFNTKKKKTQKKSRGRQRKGNQVGCMRQAIYVFVQSKFVASSDLAGSC